MGIVLTTKQSQFVTEFLRAKQAGERNPELAAVKVAYPTATKGSQGVIASQMRHNPRIQREISNLGSSPEDLIRSYWKIYDDPDSSSSAKVKALQEISILTKQRPAVARNGSRESNAPKAAQQPKQRLVGEGINAHFEEEREQLEQIYEDVVRTAPPETVTEVLSDMAARESSQSEKQDVAEVLSTTERDEIAKHDSRFHVEQSAVAMPPHPMTGILSGQIGISSEPTRTRSEDCET